MPRRPQRAAPAALTACLALLASLQSAPARAQIPPPPPASPGAGEPWTESAAVTRAAARSPSVQSAASTARTAYATAAYGRVPVLGNPTVGLRAMVGVPDREAATWAVLFGLPLDVSSRRSAYRREADHAARAADATLAATVNDARALARGAYFDLWASEQLVSVAAARERTARELLARTRARRTAEAATELDVSLSERELAGAQADVAEAERERAEARARFRQALDLAPDESVAAATPEAPAMPAGLTRDAAVRTALATRREPAALAADADRLRASIDRHRGAAVAPLFVAAEVEWQGYRAASVGASVQWSLPVAQTAQGERAVAEAEAQRSADERDLSLRAVAREAAAAYDALEAVLRELAAVRDGELPALERTLELTETLFEAGSVDAFRVLIARQDLATARARFVRLSRDALRARAALDRALGAD